MDRNVLNLEIERKVCIVALRKESVDRNKTVLQVVTLMLMSLSARRAWIEIDIVKAVEYQSNLSLSARRAWIEILDWMYHTA